MISHNEAYEKFLPYRDDWAVGGQLQDMDTELWMAINRGGCTLLYKDFVRDFGDTDYLYGSYSDMTARWIGDDDMRLLMLCKHLNVTYVDDAHAVIRGLEAEGIYYEEVI